MSNSTLRDPHGLKVNPDDWILKLIEKFKSFVDPDFPVSGQVSSQELKTYLHNVHRTLEINNYHATRSKLRKRTDDHAMKLVNRKMSNYDLPVEPSPQELQDLFNSRKQFYDDLALLHIPGCTEDGHAITVPVLIGDTAKRAKSYHTVTLLGPNGAKAEVLVDNTSNYVLAFRVFYDDNEESKKTIKWCLLAGANISDDEILKNSQKVKYSMHHDGLGHVQFWKYTLNEIFNALANIQEHPNQLKNDHKQRLLVMLFLILGEGQRFVRMQRFLIEYVESEVFVDLDPLIVKLFNVWNKLSSACLGLHLSELDYHLHASFIEAEKRKLYDGVVSRMKRVEGISCSSEETNLLGSFY